MSTDDDRPQDIFKRLGERKLIEEPDRPRPTLVATDLPTAVQASMTEVAVIWLLHRWRSAREIAADTLDQQIATFSETAIATIAGNHPVLETAGGAHLWMIYAKGLLAAGTHPREQIVDAIRAIGGRNDASPRRDPDPSPLPSDDPDVEVLDHISQALQTETGGHQGLDPNAK
ncbi:hypothetical protein IC762_09710 [Bradyrhizobium genosp. L]|uniref:hypothetical protein n=1 Tax=Bradyrhizobium genosp. L TaxID=83637 RepID=UPI0018A32D74|nr:hypothetical protein [Bradyrhizobium genosp. L]QPF86529.1 hypothetical protein IC762_09710 [Bradyrhizobium genosp. L]